ncbi:beta-lactamase/transpeptidase-like protein [Hyaloraphidium curvatum]|nr:beta-lactamase/transpeptidase-like protein [Hyaloraphidium curvatum]
MGSADTSDWPIGGFVKPGFEPVRDAFAANFEAGKELGAGYVAYYKGERVVDLFGGWQDEAKSVPFTDRSLTTVWSSGKAVLGVTVAHLVSKGLLKYDDPVAKYWPEFAAGGKEHVLVKDLCQHTAGVAWLDPDHLPSVKDTQDLDAVAEKIAGQPHNFGGEYHKIYHAVTQGWYLNELVRRTLGKSHGAFMREDVNPSLGTDVYCGFPADDPAMERRYAPVVMAKALLESFAANPAVEGSPRWKVNMTMPKGYTSGNDPELRKGESPAAFTVSNAASLARLAALCSMGGTLDGVELISREVLAHSASLDPKADGVVDMNLEYATRTCAGGTSWVQSKAGQRVPAEFPPEEAKGEGWTWRGWFGFGGSHMQFEPDRQCASAYVMNLMQPMRGADMRAAKLSLAFVECVDALEGKGGRA